MTEPTPLEVERLDITSLPAGLSLLRVRVVDDAMGDPVRIPVMVARGEGDGPVVGLTAAVHGNELNGVRVIHRAFAELAGRPLAGTVVGVPIVNIHGYLRHQRDHDDGVDLNLAMPGREGGNSPQVFAHRFVDRIVSRFDYLIDLHTASFGRVNSVYVRADLADPQTSWMARAQHPHIVVHHQGADGTLRSAAMARGIPAITVEVGDPQLFQADAVSRGIGGVLNVVHHLGIAQGDERVHEREPLVCNRSFWMYTDAGGLLEVYPEVTQRLRKGDLVARLTDVFGRVIRDYRAPADGVVVGKSTNPSATTGARILHLGIEGAPNDVVGNWPRAIE